MNDNLEKTRRFPVKIVKLGDDSHDIQYWASLSGIERLQQL